MLDARTQSPLDEQIYIYCTTNFLYTIMLTSMFPFINGMPRCTKKKHFFKPQSVHLTLDVCKQMYV